MIKRHYYFLALTLVIIAILTLPKAWATINPEQPDRFSLYVVRANDTLWQISKRYMPKVDPRAGTYFIKRVNGMSDRYTIQPGDLISVPDESGDLEEPLGDVYTSATAAREATLAAERAARESQMTASRGGQHREMVMEATAYTSHDAGMDGKGITFSGLPADRGVVAVDPGVIEIGSVVHVSGYGYAVALDQGGAIQGSRIDVYFHDIAKAREWGRRQVRVKVIR